MKKIITTTEAGFPQMNTAIAVGQAFANGVSESFIQEVDVFRARPCANVVIF